MAHGDEQRIGGELGYGASALPVASVDYVDAENADAVSDLTVAAAASAIRVTSVAGAAEGTPPGEVYAVTGMTATSVIIAVLHISTLASVATIETVAPALFTPGVDTATSLTEVDRSNDQMLFIWADV